jgi:4-amino-4-deoxy-L-arabinose transferase-like glycosyltransferase
VGGGLHLFGMGIFQARITALVCITLTLALTFRLGATLFSPWHGVIALAALAGWRIAGFEGSFFSGVPMADVARIARYDVAVPLFGFAALLIFIQTLRRPSGRKFFAVGLLTGLATLSHVYGIFWLPVLLLLIVLYFRRVALKVAGWTLAGFGLTLAPWLLFISADWSDFLNQNRSFSGRFDLFDPAFYLTNLFTEGERYQPIIDALSRAWGARLGLILMMISLVVLVARAVRRGDRASQLLLLTLGILFSLFALLISVKMFSYLAALWPLFALVVAVGWMSFWKFSPRWRWKLLLVLIFYAVMLEGGIRFNRVQALAAQVTPYRSVMIVLASRLPADSRVMGLQDYWFGLAQQNPDYRSILVPIDWTIPEYVGEPITFGEAAQAIPPDYIVINDPMLKLLAEASKPASPIRELAQQMRDYLHFRHARLVSGFSDSTYGHILIYQLDSAP